MKAYETVTSQTAGTRQPDEGIMEQSRHRQQAHVSLMKVSWNSHVTDTDTGQPDEGIMEQ